VCWRKQPGHGLLSAWNRKLPGLDQPRDLAYIVAVTSHLGVEVPKLKLAKLKKYGVLAEIAKFNAHQILLLYSIFPTYRGRGFPTYPSRVWGEPPLPKGCRGFPIYPWHGRSYFTYPGRGVPTYTGSGWVISIL